MLKIIMDIEWGSAASGKFLTNVGLITSNGEIGHNIMAAEWTHHISYNPGLISIHIHSWDTTAENITKSKEFGVNIANDTQNEISSVAGGSHGKEIDKIAVLKELGIEFYKAKKIDVLMIKDAALNVECRLVRQDVIGDHVMFIGEAVEVTVNEKTNPIVYHGGKYLKVGEKVQTPSKEMLNKIEGIVQKHLRK